MPLLLADEACDWKQCLESILLSRTPTSDCLRAAPENLFAILKMSGFSYNVSYTIAANRGITAPEERLSRAELWQGVKHGARHPGDFAEHVQSCTVLSGSGNKFVREIVIGDGGVHAKKGKEMVQDVFLQDDLFVRHFPAMV